jgi:ribosomal protein S18 acetylase RimI-like enzyme
VPAVRLRPMTAEEFDAWRGRAVEDYAADLTRTGRTPAEDAPRKAEESFRSLLPKGIDTVDHVLWIGEDAESGERIGTLWLGPADDPTRAWVWTVEVDEPFRGRGYGTALMKAFETEAAARGFRSVGLNVFGDNEAAKHLYASLGYTEIARQMAKPLTGDGRGPSGAGT